MLRGSGIMLSPGVLLALVSTGLRRHASGTPEMERPFLERRALLQVLIMPPERWLQEASLILLIQ